MAKTMKRIAIISVLLTVAFGVLYQTISNSVIFSLMITSGTIAYHFIIRLLIGTMVNWKMKNKADVTKKWYYVSVSELKLYDKLKVKKWKNKMPTYDEDTFDVSKHTWEEIIQATCQSEIVHEVNALFSFFPIVASVWFGSFGVFLITSTLGAAFDMMFVCMQRFNRSRLLKMVTKRKHTHSKSGGTEHE